MGRALIIALAGLAAMATAGCATPPDAEPRTEAADAEGATVSGDGFDVEASAEALAMARVAEAEGRLSEARSAYREAAWLWPDNLEAWQGLAAVARRQGDAPTAEAASFVAERVRTYPSQQVYVQRQVNDALKRYIAERRELPEANPTTLEFADRLVGFYDVLYAERGAYTPLERGYLNVEAEEIPAVVGTGALGLLYGLSLGVN